MPVNHRARQRPMNRLDARTHPPSRFLASLAAMDARIYRPSRFLASVAASHAAMPVDERSRMVDAWSAVEDAMAVAERQRPSGADVPQSTVAAPRTTVKRPRPPSPWRQWPATGTTRTRARRRGEHPAIVSARAGARAQTGRPHAEPVATTVDDAAVERGCAPREEHSDIVSARAAARAAATPVGTAAETCPHVKPEAEAEEAERAEEAEQDDTPVGTPDDADAAVASGESCPHVEPEAEAEQAEEAVDDAGDG